MAETAPVASPFLQHRHGLWRYLPDTDEYVCACGARIDAAAAIVLYPLHAGKAIPAITPVEYNALMRRLQQGLDQHG